MDWSIQQIARLAGTTSRTLRHYGDVGLLEPSRIGSNGYRYYDELALARLQRILMLRDLGLGIPAIAQVLAGERDDRRALGEHLRWLEAERERLERQAAAVRTTIRKLNEGEQMMAQEMFDGFDNTQYREEVEQRWGADAYAASDTWWRSMDGAERRDWQEKVAQLIADWADAAERGVDPESDEAQSLAQRQFDWLSDIPGTPSAPGGGPTREYFEGLGDLYVADERFARNYGGPAGAAFVRDTLRTYAARHL